MSYLVKQTKRSFLKQKGNLFLLIMFSFLTSFMYFFVRFSIDSNMTEIMKRPVDIPLTESMQQFIIALESNSKLADSLLFMLTGICAFSFYMFYRNYFSRNRRIIGCYKGLGFSEGQLCATYALSAVIISFIGTILGLIGGYFASDILLDAYISSYEVAGVIKGIGLKSFMLGMPFVILIMVVVSLLSCRYFYKKDASGFLQQGELYSKPVKSNHLCRKIVSCLPKSWQQSSRIALRRPVTLILILGAVIVLSVMFILSYSLNRSSSRIVQNQTAGRDYEFELRFKEFQIENEQMGIDDKLEQNFLFADGKLSKSSNKLLEQQVVGIEDGEYFQLINKKGEHISALDANEIIIGPELIEVYGFHIGDEIKVEINNGSYQAVVKEVAQNAQANTIYMKKSELASLLHTSPTAYNGSWTNVRGEENNLLKVVSREQRQAELERGAVSNRISAIINQVIGCVVGILLIYLAILLSFQERGKDILVLDMIGYTPKQINHELLRVYFAAIMLFCTVSFYPSIAIVQGIQRNLSIQTRDYMPFEFTFAVIPVIIFVLIVIYYFAQVVFTQKIKKIVKSERSSDYYG